MSQESYFELRCAVVEMFYENLLDENYTLGQAAARCLADFQSEVEGGGGDALVILSVLLSTVARQNPKELASFAAETDALRSLSETESHWESFSADEKERMQEDIEFTLEKA